MKRLLAFTLGLAIFVLLVPGMRAHAATVNVYVNGTKIQSDQPAFLDTNANRTFVPLRFVAEALGSNVDWDSSKQTAIVNKDDVTISMKIGSNRPEVNGSVKNIDAPARLMNGRTMVPLRFVSEVQGANVEWVGQERAVYITTCGECKPISKDVVPFKGTPINPNDYTTGERQRVPFEFRLPNSQMMNVTLSQLQQNPVKLGNDTHGWRTIYDMRIEKDTIYVTQDGSEFFPLPMVLAKGNDLSAQRNYTLAKYDKGPFTHNYSVSTQATPAKIEEVSHIMLLYGNEVLSVQNPYYSGK